jgi:hypothetical protein
MSEMPAEEGAASMWRLLDDQRTVRFQLPKLALDGRPEPLSVYLNFDAEAVDEILQRLSELRARMLPPPRRQ